MDVTKIRTETKEVQFDIILFLWLVYLWKLYIDFRQYLLLKKTISRPDHLKLLPKEKFHLSRYFIIDKITFSFINSTSAIILSTIEIYYGFYSKYWNLAGRLMPWKSDIIQNCIWFNILHAVYTLFDFPFSLYDTFVFDDDSEVTEQSVTNYIFNGFKSFIIMQILSIPISALTVCIIQKGGNFSFILLWFLSIIIHTTCFNFYPNYLANIHESFIPCPECELRNLIENMAEQLEFPLTEIYIFERAQHIIPKNKGVVSITKNNCILLRDTLFQKNNKEGLSTDEIISIVAHEFCHWKNSHFYKILPILGLYYLSILSIFSCIYRFELLYTAFGFPYKIQPKLAGLAATVVYILAPYNVLATFVINTCSQKLEYEADKFTVELGLGDALTSALVKLNEGNFVCCVYDPLYSCRKLNHPSLPERLDMIKELREEDESESMTASSTNLDNTIYKKSLVKYETESTNLCYALFDYQTLNDRLMTLIQTRNRGNKYSDSGIAFVESDNSCFSNTINRYKSTLHRKVLQEIFVNQNFKDGGEYDEENDFQQLRKAMSQTTLNNDKLIKLPRLQPELFL